MARSSGSPGGAAVVCATGCFGRPRTRSRVNWEILRFKSRETIEELLDRISGKTRFLQIAHSLKTM
jgi:hypothetical protein